MHWCDVINELSEDGDTNEHALNPFNGHMVKKQRSSWNITPNYKMRDFFNKMNNETSFNPDKMPTFIFGKQENDADLKHMCLGFLFLERKSYPNDRLGGIIDQTPIFKSVTDFAHGYMMSYSYINCEVPDVTTKTVKIDGYVQQFYNHMMIQNLRLDAHFDFSNPRSYYLRDYVTGLINPQWISPVGWMLVGKSILENTKISQDLKSKVISRYKSAIVDMSNIEGLFANVGSLACDLTPMNEIYETERRETLIKALRDGVKDISEKAITSYLTNFECFRRAVDSVVGTEYNEGIPMPDFIIQVNEDFDDPRSREAHKFVQDERAERLGKDINEANEKLQEIVSLIYYRARNVISTLVKDTSYYDLGEKKDMFVAFGTNFNNTKYEEKVLEIIKAANL